LEYIIKKGYLERVPLAHAPDKRSNMLRFSRKRDKKI
jgi:hypothetical protein